MDNDENLREEQKRLAERHSQEHRRRYAKRGSGSDSGVSKKAPPSFSEILSQVMEEEAPEVLRLKLQELLSYPEYEKDADGNYVLMEVEREVKGAVGERKTVKKGYRIPVRKVYPKLPEHMTNRQLIGYFQLLALMGIGGDFNRNFLADLYELEGRMAAAAELRKSEQQGEPSLRERIEASVVRLMLQRGSDFHMSLPGFDDVIDAVPGARENLGIPRDQPVTFPPTTLTPFFRQDGNAPGAERIPVATEENRPHEPEGEHESTEKEDQ